MIIDKPLYTIGSFFVVPAQPVRVFTVDPGQPGKWKLPTLSKAVRVPSLATFFYRSNEGRPLFVRGQKIGIHSR
jgi:hypothetical protein